MTPAAGDSGVAMRLTPAAMPSIPRLARFLALIGLPLALAGPAAAVDRAAVTGAELRLLTGLVLGADASLGLEVVLERGWKTYWRSPGDSGIPPSIDHAGSVNVAALAVGFPAPTRFGDGNGESIGYTAPVVLPLRVRLADPAKPATVKLKVFLGVCREICVPAEAELTAVLDRSTAPRPQAVTAISAAKARMPVPWSDDAPFTASGLGRSRDGKAIEFEVRTAEPAPGLDVFVEGPEGWALPLAARQGDGPVWRVALEGLPKGADPKGAELRLTLSDGRRAVEQVLRIP